MIANYHTHTWRCNHAQDIEREYVEAAVARGIRTLGFADHAPYFFDGDYYSGFRMKREQYQDYVDTLRGLKQEFAGKIDIRIGVEMEYYPKYFEKTLDFMGGIGLDYIIMGQHFLDHTESWHAYKETDDECVLARYVDVVLEGAATGAYSYIAHPDHFHFVGDGKTWHKHMLRLCEGLKEMDVPVEMNLLGFLEGRHYPRRDFFEVVSEAGTKVVLGCDAHSKAQMGDAEIALRGVSWLAEMNIVPEKEIPLRKPVVLR